MSKIEDAYLKALFADAAYVDFTRFPIENGVISEDYRKAFTDGTKDDGVKGRNNRGQSTINL